MRARLFDLPGGFVEQGSALGCGAVEVRENLAVLPLQDDRLAARRWTRLEAAETIVNVREPVAALCVFALIDHIDASLALTRNDVGNHLAQIGVVFTAWPVGAVWARQAADMGRENLFSSA
jgi:GAF domain-containing protein